MSAAAVYVCCVLSLAIPNLAVLALAFMLKNRKNFAGSESTTQAWAKSRQQK